ncbi:MAG: PAS domain S-box protein, partial [Sphingomonas sp.]|nr:PAS domain S-box protein [Sphingomonas sp.]
MSDDDRRASDYNASIDQLVEPKVERDPLWRNSLDILAVADADGVFRAVSPAWKRVLGHDEVEVIGHSFRDFAIDDDAEFVAQSSSETGPSHDVNSRDSRYRHKNGSSRLLSWHTSAENGFIYGRARDVTRERAHSRQLAKCAAERERLWRTNPMLFARAAYDSTILEVNPAWTAMLGWTQKELVGKSYAEYVHADDAERSLEWARRKANGQTVEELQNRYRCKDGGTRWIAWAISADDDVFHCVGRDITEQRAQAEAVEALEAHLRQSQKMEAVGQLTGGIAHDFNNMLTGVIAGLDIIKRRLAEQRYDDIDRFVAAAGQSADRAADLVKRLMAFSRQQPLTIETIDVNMLTGRIEGMLRQALGT